MASALPKNPAQAVHRWVLIPANAGILIALLQLLYFHLALDAASRSQAAPWNRFADVETELKKSAATRQNIQLHLSDPIHDSGDQATAQADGFTRIYYLASYLLYPRHVYVGTDDRLINGAEQLLAGDQIPSTAWMKQHYVRDLGIVYGIELIPHLRIVLLP
jgi:hypothetical protein